MVWYSQVDADEYNVYRRKKLRNSNLSFKKKMVRELILLNFERSKFL